MKNIILLLVGLAIGISVTVFTAFKEKPKYQDSTAKYIHINILESVVQGGAGRSRCIITFPDGKSEEFDLENYYSMVGVNFGNIKQNDAKIALRLNLFAKEGYRIVSQSSGGSGIYTTRIIMMKP
ncbi:MAG: hypothetical protein MUE81_13425 [Thermoflexibacter sp.]|jgi:hypothetical protein|nr:hypothetical protein [Thermoflexibacter sp.]